MTIKDDEAELAEVEATLTAFDTTVERLKKDKTVREAVAMLKQAFKGHSATVIIHVLGAITEDVSARAKPGLNWLATARRRNVLKKRLSKKQAA